MSQYINVFVSSTSQDLSAYRSKVVEVIGRSGLHPIVMEWFNATDRPPLQRCYDAVEKADIFVGIYAHRYGYIPQQGESYVIDGRMHYTDGKTSITHQEYLWAVDRHLRMLLFIVGDKDENGDPLLWPADWIDDEPGKTQLEIFKAQLKSNHVVNFFYSADHLAAQLATGLAEAKSGVVVKDAPQPIFQAIAPLDFFVGRETETALIQEQFSAGKSAVIIRGGVGGLGKTALAAYAAHQLRDHFPDGVLWARLDTDSTMSIFVAFLSAFGERHTTLLAHLNTSDSRGGYYRTFLANKRCLIVLDNAESVHQVIPLLPPSTSPTRVIVTTRYALAHSIPNSFELPLGSLNNEAARALLIYLLKRSDDMALAGELCRALGNLPLALQIAAGIILELGWDLRTYYQHLETSKTLDWLSDEGASQSVRATFEISYNNLPNETTKRAFRILGIFPGASFSAPVVAAILGKTVDETERILLSLKSRGLVEISSEKANTFYLHPLMRLYASELLTHLNEAVLAHATAGDYFRSQLKQVQGTAFSYGDVATEADVENGLSAVFHFFHAQKYSEAQDVLVAIADGLSLRGRWDELIEWIKDLSATVPLAPWLELYWGEWIATGKDDLSPERGKQILQQLTSNPDAKVASAAFIAMAALHFKDSRFDEAAVLLNQSITLKQQMSPPDQKGIAYIHNELARIRLQSGGTPQEALEIYSQALKMQKAASDIKGLAYTLRKMGGLYLYHLEDMETAERLFLESEQLTQQTGDKTNYIALLSEKAEILRRQQRYAEAVDVLKQAEQLAPECQAPVTEAYVLKRLALIYEDVELYGQAYRYATQSFDLFVQLDDKQADKLKAAVSRLEQKRTHLEAELQKVNADIQEIENKLLVTEQITSEEAPVLRAERRTLNRRAKRLRQKLGLEPGQIRLGR